MNVTMPTWLTVLRVAHGKEEMGVSVRTPESTFKQKMLMKMIEMMTGTMRSRLMMINLSIPI